MKNAYCIIILLIALPHSSCTWDIDNIKHTDTKPSCHEFVLNNTFPYKISKHRKDIIFRNYKKLKPGLQKDEVEQIIGSPDCRREGYTKSADPEYIGTSWTYFFEKPDPDIVNMVKDKSILLFFDPDANLRSVASNITGLNNISWDPE